MVALALFALSSIGVYDVRRYGAVGNGVADDTAAVQAAHDAAVASRGVLYLPLGTFKAALVWNPNVSIMGATADGSVLLGKPSTDVIRVDPALTESYGSSSSVRNITLRVDDSVNASASFPQRGGVGNAGLAIDYANGANPYPRRLVYVDMENVKVESLSGVGRGQNASAGFYLQAGANLSRFRNLTFRRLVYGWWDHYPTSNLTSVEFFNDHNHFDSIYCNACENAVRFVNHSNSSITNLVIHGSGTTGFQGIGAASLNRANCFLLTFDGVTVEAVDSPWKLTGEAHTVAGASWTGAVGSAVPIESSYSTYDTLWVSTNVANLISITGSRNTIIGLWDAASPSVAAVFTDSGAGNTVTWLGNAQIGAVSLKIADGNGSLTSNGNVYIDAVAGGSVFLRTAGNASALNANSTGGLQHTGNALGFFSKTPVGQPAANADTSGATLAALETEVNELKAALRSLGLIAT